VDAGLTQRQLADRAGVCLATIHGLEAGRKGSPRLKTAQSVAYAVGTVVAELWPTLAKAMASGRLLDTVIPFNRAVKARAAGPRGLKLVYRDVEGGTPVHHLHRPPICCGALWCRCVDLSDPETYRVIGEPVLIASVVSA
jgi:DNA-binding XRE family transcriptional regulator